MTLSGRPLLDNVMDAALFVGRDAELAVIVTALRRELNVCVLAEPGLGKTSLLRMLMYRLRSADSDPHAQLKSAGITDDWILHYVRTEGATDAASLITRIGEDLLGRAYDPHAMPNETIAALSRHRQDLATAHRARPRPDLGAAAPRLQAVVILDDVPGAGGHELFSRYRDELWASGYRWVVAAHQADQALLGAPTDAFFERVVELDPLGEASAVRLIERRQLWPPGWAEQVARAVGGNPRRLLSVARDFAERPEELAPTLTAIGRRDAAIAALGRPAAVLASELEVLGAASASDEALLNRLGWTRARATQVLGQLDRAGYVRSAPHKLAHGRPKRVFRLVSPEEYATLPALPAAKPATNPLQA